MRKRKHNAEKDATQPPNNALPLDLNGEDVRTNTSSAQNSVSKKRKTNEEEPVPKPALSAAFWKHDAKYHGLVYSPPKDVLDYEAYLARRTSSSTSLDPFASPSSHIPEQDTARIPVLDPAGIDDDSTEKGNLKSQSSAAPK